MNYQDGCSRVGNMTNKFLQATTRKRKLSFTRGTELMQTANTENNIRCDDFTILKIRKCFVIYFIFYWS
jgi:hypothetical protein